MKRRQIPPHPPEAVKNFQQREMVTRPCPGREQIKDAKKGAAFSVARGVFNPLGPRANPFCSGKNIPKSAASLGGSRASALRPSISRRFWRPKFAPPPDNERGFQLAAFEFLHSCPFSMGEKVEGILLLRRKMGRWGHQKNNLMKPLRGPTPSWRV